mgnify:CR=1 FL=1
MRKIIVLFFVASMALGVMTIGHIVYKSFFAPTERIAQTYIVKHGDTWYQICNDTYMDGNAECFNEFWSRNMTANDNRQLQPGDVITIVNKIYK